MSADPYKDGRLPIHIEANLYSPIISQVAVSRRAKSFKQHLRPSSESQSELGRLVLLSLQKQRNVNDV